MALKSGVRFILKSGVAKMLIALLNGALAILMLKGRAIGWLYGKIWPSSGLEFYDQRFVCMTGPHNWRWAERGFFAYQSAKPGAIMLDLCCGDGIYPGLFLRGLNGSIDAIDRNVQSVAAARRRYGSSDVRFHVADVVADPFPRERYDMVSCFASLQYFSAEDVDRLLSKVARVVDETRGTFVGSVPVFGPPRVPDPAAARNFKSEAEVRDLMSRHFDEVETWCSTWSPGLTHCYFRCALRP